MKQLLGIALLLGLTVAAGAETIDVGGVEVVVPLPEGFERVTPAMGPTYKLSLQFAMPGNDQLAYYILEDEVPIAMQGEIPDLTRTCMLAVNQRVKDVTIGDDDFASIKSETKRAFGEIARILKSKMPEYTENLSRNISNEFDTPVDFSISQVIPLDPHFEDDRTLAISAYVNYGIASDEGNEKVIVACTTTLINAGGKVLQLNCYADQHELMRTRDLAHTWAEAIRRANPEPPARSRGLGRFNFKAFVNSATIGGLAGLLGALVAVLAGARALFKKTTPLEPR